MPPGPHDAHFPLTIVSVTVAEYVPVLPYLIPDAHLALIPGQIQPRISRPQLLAQPTPRLFSTHLYGDWLPDRLTDPNHGTGKLIFVVRNTKDMLASLHFFRGEATDGWYGNEHGCVALF